MKRNRVTFYSPGTFVAETTTTDIDKWDAELACAMARKIVERYGATPYAFQFSEEEGVPFGSKETKRSGTYFLGGVVVSAEEVERREPDSILASNLRCNKWSHVIESEPGANGYRWCQPFNSEKDRVVDPETGAVRPIGSSPSPRAEEKGGR